MDILEQLLPVFKSSSTVNIEDGGNLGLECGALLTVRRDLLAGNYSPFFSDSYAKAHRMDIFMDYQKLLLENTFRLLYSLVRPKKSGERKPSAIKDLKLDGYQDILCSYINNPHTTFVRRIGIDEWKRVPSVEDVFALGGLCGFSREGKETSISSSSSDAWGTSSLSPLVPIREVNFLRFCKQHAEGVWAVVDGSVDRNRDTSNPQTFVSSRRLHSGCVVQDIAFVTRRLNPEEAYSENYTHCEIHPSLILGVCASIIPFPDHNQVTTINISVILLENALDSDVGAKPM
ncbi:hypothetical protein GIB67_002383 [Kingdonia uniflora]|uniref:START domain-containing protein n=1 Tax=Kingdonia uniflora TaxID=39325 RepID=A0A7J7M8B2_9MAGN|nr:hypothetical protein GIB67_002383 [Kingdonia uniflora]